MLAEDGVRIVKIFLHITPEEQLRRFRERLTNPYKRWKFTGEDIRNRARWGDYQKAAEKMFRLTSAKEAPWHAVFANRKWYARIKSLEIITRELSRGLDIEAPALDPALQRAAAEQLGIRLEG